MLIKSSLKPGKHTVSSGQVAPLAVFDNLHDGPDEHSAAGQGLAATKAVDPGKPVSCDNEWLPEQERQGSERKI